ncbi:uncharacterized protein [Ptychodera flava]|uniref:uncharacterized protein n=1 Tax=Ptychodera flava TaxID=63121 RepID=UPI00396A3D9B
MASFTETMKKVSSFFRRASVTCMKVLLIVCIRLFIVMPVRALHHLQRLLLDDNKHLNVGTRFIQHCCFVGLLQSTFGVTALLSGGLLLRFVNHLLGILVILWQYQVMINKEVKFHPVSMYAMRRNQLLRCCFYLTMTVWYLPSEISISTPLYIILAVFVVAVIEDQVQGKLQSLVEDHFDEMFDTIRHEFNFIPPSVRSPKSVSSSIWFNLHNLNGFEEYQVIIWQQCIIVMMSLFLIILKIFQWMQGYDPDFYLTSPITWVNTITVCIANLYIPCFKVKIAQLEMFNGMRRTLDIAKATDEQLMDHDDDCPVCLLPLKKGRITRCGHVFHAKCLARHLEFRGNCPMCLQPLFQPESQIRQAVNDVMLQANLQADGGDANDDDDDDDDDNGNQAIGGDQEEDVRPDIIHDIHIPEMAVDFFELEPDLEGDDDVSDDSDDDDDDDGGDDDEQDGGIDDNDNSHGDRGGDSNNDDDKDDDDEVDDDDDDDNSCHGTGDDHSEYDTGGDGDVDDDEDDDEATDDNDDEDIYDDDYDD